MKTTAASKTKKPASVVKSKAAVKKSVPSKKVIAKKVPATKVVVAKKPVAKKAAAVKKPVAKKPVAAAKKVVPVKKAAPVAAKVVKTVKAAAVKAPAKVAPVKAIAKTPVKAPAKAPVKAAVKPAAKVVASPAVKAAPATTPGRVSKTTGKPSGKPIVPTTTFANPQSNSMAVVRNPVIPHMIHVAVKKNPKLVDSWKKKSVEELSDEEIIAMPDSEYMNAVQLAYFRLKLVENKNSILASADRTTENLKEDSSIVPDPADRATIEEEHALELRTRDRERKLLKKIEQSIARVDAGDYGYCDETGEPIGVSRLLARPTASLSLEAQTRRELKQKMFGD